MLVGGGATCPGCLQSDATQKVSVIVNAANGNLSPREFEWLSSVQREGKSTDWPAPRQEPSWESVARKLTRPPKPTMPVLARWSYSNVRGVRYLIWFILFLALASLATLIPETTGLVFLGAFLVSILIVFGWLNYSNRERKKLEAKLDRWGKAQSKWYQLWYCARDNCVFEAGQRRLIAPEQLAAFLSE